MTRKLLPVLVALSLLAGGCAKSPAPQGTTQPPQEQQARPDEEARQVGTMGPEQKSAEIAQTFPLEVPVPAGEVVRGQAQGEDAWDYEVVVDAAPIDVATWYVEAYQGRSWEIVGQKQIVGLSGEKAIEISLRKGGASSRVTISAQGDSTLAAGTVGIGPDVLQTQ